MRKMIISAMLASAALVVALPASAQPGYGGRGGYDQSYGRGGYDQNQSGSRGWARSRYDREFQQLEQRIQSGLRSRQISPREADRLRRELRDVRMLHRTYFRDGRLDNRERRDLEQRIDRLQRQIRSERRDWDNGRNDYRNDGRR